MVPYSFRLIQLPMGLRVLALGAAVAVCTSLTGCAGESHGAEVSWSAAGNNGGKVDRYAVARAAAANASVEVASTPTAAGRSQ